MSPMFVCSGVRAAERARPGPGSELCQSKNLFTLEASLSNVTKCFPDLYGYYKKPFPVEYFRTKNVKIIKLSIAEFS